MMHPEPVSPGLLRLPILIVICEAAPVIIGLYALKRCC